MVLQISDATPSDVEQIASLHLISFDSNPLLHVQFPTPESLTSLRSILSHDMKRTIQHTANSKKKILVVRDSNTKDQIISFAKWDLPISPGLQQELHPGAQWHQDVRQEYLDTYHDLAEAAKQRVIGDTPCYREAPPFVMFPHQNSVSLPVAGVHKKGHSLMNMHRTYFRWHASVLPRSGSSDPVD